LIIFSVGQISDIDKSGSGTIDFSELEMMTVKMSERDSREEILKAFRLFDDDETGTVQRITMSLSIRTLLLLPYYHITNFGLFHKQDIFLQLEASGEGAGREHDGREVAGDDRRGGQRRRRRDFRGRVLAYHEENIAVLMRPKYAIN